MSHGPEHTVQALFIQWTELMAKRWPELELIYAIPNEGARSRRARNKMLGEGLRRGVPDLCLPVPRGGFHGLYLETKVDTQRPTGAGGTRRYRSQPTEAQRWWIARLREQGYHVCIYRSAEEGQVIVTEYLSGRIRRREDACQH